MMYLARALAATAAARDVSVSVSIAVCPAPRVCGDCDCADENKVDERRVFQPHLQVLHKPIEAACVCVRICFVCGYTVWYSGVRCLALNCLISHIIKPHIVEPVHSWMDNDMYGSEYKEGWIYQCLLVCTFV